jgi:hypothetical protein
LEQVNSTLTGQSVGAVLQPVGAVDKGLQPVGAVLHSSTTFQIEAPAPDDSIRMVLLKVLQVGSRPESIKRAVKEYCDLQGTHTSTVLILVLHSY